MALQPKSVKPVGPRARRSLVLYDGRCELCRKSVGLLRSLDWLGVLGYVDARDAGQVEALALPVPPERLLAEMHLLTPARACYHGFGALRWMAWRLPLLWFIAPLLYLPGAGTLGQRLYLWVARNRFRLVPCHGGVCRLRD